MNEDNEYMQQLVSEARSGSRSGMGHLAVVVWERLYPFVLHTTWNHDLTEDILQETLMTVILRLTFLRETRRFWPWVYRIARNKIRDNLRHRRLQSNAKAALLRNHSENIHTGSQSLLDARIHEETLRQLSDMVEQLSYQHRDVLHLRCYEQMPYAEIASLTRSTPQRARARFHRAKKTLKAHLL